MKIYRNIDIDYGANTEFMETFNVKEAEREAARQAAYEYSKSEDEEDDEYEDEYDAAEENMVAEAYEAELSGDAADE